MPNETFTYRFDLDRDYFIDFSMRYQSMLPFVALFTFRPLILIMLMKKKDYMEADIRLGYLVNQIAMICQEFNFCFFFRIHVLAPYAGLYCDGPICRMGIEKPYLMVCCSRLSRRSEKCIMILKAILAFFTIGTLPTFLFLLFRMHQLIIASTQSRLKLSRRTLRILLALISVLLMSNVAGFFSFARDCSNSTEMEKVGAFTTLHPMTSQIPDLSWLKKRGGTLFLIGMPGQAEFFKEELLLLACSIALIAPFIGCATLHSIIVLRGQKQLMSSMTQRSQSRLIRVFFIQLIGVHFFYLFPLSMMLMYMTIDITWIFSTWHITIGRCAFLIFFTLEGTQLSLIFLLKNPLHRQVSKWSETDLYTSVYRSSKPSFCLLASGKVHLLLPVVFDKPYPQHGNGETSANISKAISDLRFEI
ncbi:hypothetical protein PRIPAC_78519 [Pristionchus pacificus]|uniref:Uncharacterized protein n=1 Tax=Pristionchus pacificus TaxID=54126 RepID=A0A2A6CNX1_PRIPA|nr:hypothetical protein PRIPAC_78519 [Pristionchus pacificus]|eukprot:PDM79829.1 hypothetical protein PRIPAC_32408 [Pristionchus pacificus]